jgi:hypothetical protein
MKTDLNFINPEDSPYDKISIKKLSSSKSSRFGCKIFL